MAYGGYDRTGAEGEAEIATIDPVTGNYTITVRDGVDIRV